MSCPDTGVHPAALTANRCRAGGRTLPGPSPAQLAQLRTIVPGTSLRG
jgi:hypothetical protein